jgi:sugar phosphate isomerase/epimerase
MIFSAVTLSLIPEARGGPFVFWDDLPAAARKAAALGFDAIEIFPPSPDAVAADSLRTLLDQHNLKLAAIGTGGGFVRHGLTLTSPDPAIRERAKEFIRSMITAAAKLNASAIVGSMAGRWTKDLPRDAALDHLRSALPDLAAHAQSLGRPLFFEPLNRYESNLINTLADGLALVRSLDTGNIKLLADLYHMNIEEPDLAASLRSAGQAIGHVHFADSNRRPIGSGHTDVAAIAAALREIKYDGYLSAECLPYPDSDSAAEATIRAFRQYFR